MRLTEEQKKEVIEFNITNIENLLIETEGLNKGSHGHDINVYRGKLHRLLKCKKRMKKMNDPYFSELCKIAQAMKALYFEANKLKLLGENSNRLKG